MKLRALVITLLLACSIPSFAQTATTERSNSTTALSPGYTSVQSSLGLMIRTLINPRCFGLGLKRDQAATLLTAIRDSKSWLASKTLRVETPLF